MKRFLIAVAALSTFAASAQIIVPDTARVVNSQPQYETVRTPGRCSNVPVSTGYQSGPSTGQTVINTIVGAAVGSQFGQGTGRDAMIALGAATGAMVGQNNRGGTQYQQVCEPEQVTQRIRGYFVTYEYQGRTATATLPYQPGPTIELVITVDVARGQQQGQYNQYQQHGQYNNQYPGTRY